GTDRDGRGEAPRDRAAILRGPAPSYLLWARKKGAEMVRFALPSLVVFLIACGAEDPDSKPNGNDDSGNVGPEGPFDLDEDGVFSDTDCNDSDAAIHPGASETCNGLDDDCNGTIDDKLLATFYRDADGDGFGNLGELASACAMPGGYVTDSTDCNDGDAAIHLG